MEEEKKKRAKGLMRGELAAHASKKGSVCGANKGNETMCTAGKSYLPMRERGKGSSHEGWVGDGGNLRILWQPKGGGGEARRDATAFKLWAPS